MSNSLSKLTNFPRHNSKSSSLIPSLVTPLGFDYCFPNPWSSVCVCCDEKNGEVNKNWLVNEVEM